MIYIALLGLFVGLISATCGLINVVLRYKTYQEAHVQFLHFTKKHPEYLDKLKQEINNE